METTANTGCGAGEDLSSIKVGDREIDLAVKEGPMGYQLVGVVMAHQG